MITLTNLRPIPWASSYPDISDGPLLYLQTVAQHNCPLKVSIQHLTETDAEAHSLSLDRSQGVFWKSWGKGLRACKGTGSLLEDLASQLTCTLGDSQKVTHQPKSKHRVGQGPTIYVVNVLQCSHGSWNKQSGGMSLMVLSVCPTCQSLQSNLAALSDLSSRDLTCHDWGILKWSPLPGQMKKS